MAMFKGNIVSCILPTAGLVSSSRPTSKFGDRCFTVVSLRLWNSLPGGLTQMDIGYEQFEWLLKTYVLGC